MFIGRKSEIKELLVLKKLKKSAFVVCSGRRRIGKSTLIEHASHNFTHFYEFQGLHPKEAPKQEQQLNHFAEQMRLYFKTPKMIFNSWTEAFTELSRRITPAHTLLFLDEISWLSSGAETFSAELKSAWDTLFKKHAHLIIVIAGSVSSWIEDNILNNTNFLGRVTLNLHLDELPLSTLKEFWEERNAQISTYNLIKTVAIFGAVPLYLELQNPLDSLEQNLHRLCFKKTGPLVDEFDKIFSDIFSRRGPIYKKIIQGLLDRPKTLTELATTMKTEKSGALSKYLSDLVNSGFLSADTTYNFQGKPTKTVRYRVCDNYIRFALKYIEPSRGKIKDGLFRFSSLEQLPGWPSIFGLQFENLILKNKILILDYLEIDPNSVVACSPFLQRKNSKNKGGCQIDLLIVLKTFHIFLCEIKLQPKISSSVVDDIQRKIKVLQRPRHYSLQPVLIYCGELAPKLRAADDWLKLVSIEDLLY
jgi:AAA+ ATPase superfamily predicted ATPase